MIKKLTVKELELGMYVCGIEKAGATDPEFFMNNILIRTDKDLSDFVKGNHKAVYVDVKEAPPIFREEPKEEAATEFDSFQSIDTQGEFTEEVPSTEELTDEEYIVDSSDTSNLMGLFDPVGDSETAASTEDEGNEFSVEPIETASFFNEEDGERPALEVIELEEPEAFFEPEAIAEPEIIEEPETMEVDEKACIAAEPEAIEVPEAIEEIETTEELEIETGPPAFVEPEPVEEPEASADFEAVEELEIETGPPAFVEPEPIDEPESFAEPEPVEETGALAEPEAEEEALTVETDEPLRLAEKSAEEEAPQKEIRDRVSFDEELQAAQKVRGEAENLVRDFMGRVRIDGDVMPDQVNDTVGRMVESVFRNQDALASLSRLKSRDDYTFGHCVNVCILSLAIGRHMGLGERELNELGVGALLHDIGKMLVPEEILKKPGRLTDQELSEMQRHPTLGGELLYKTNEISAASRTVPAHHHERFDGSGYNDGLLGTDIHLFARIGAVADVYDAMTSNRVYQNGLAAEVALRRMYQNKGVLFEPVLVDRLIKCLGIYPIGTLVELNTGEMAVVCMPNHADPLKPRVLMLYDRSKRRLPGPVDVDLAADTDREITASRDPGPLAGMIEKLIA